MDFGRRAKIAIEFQGGPLSRNRTVLLIQAVGSNRRVRTNVTSWSKTTTAPLMLQSVSNRFPRGLAYRGNILSDGWRCVGAE